MRVYEKFSIEGSDRTFMFVEGYPPSEVWLSAVGGTKIVLWPFVLLELETGQIWAQTHTKRTEKEAVDGQDGQQGDQSGIGKEPADGQQGTEKSLGMQWLDSLVLLGTFKACELQMLFPGVEPANVFVSSPVFDDEDRAPRSVFNIHPEVYVPIEPDAVQHAFTGQIAALIEALGTEAGEGELAAANDAIRTKAGGGEIAAAIDAVDVIKQEPESDDDVNIGESSRVETKSIGESSRVKMKSTGEGSRVEEKKPDEDAMTDSFDYEPLPPQLKLEHDRKFGSFNPPYFSMVVPSWVLDFMYDCRIARGEMPNGPPSPESCSVFRALLDARKKMPGEWNNVHANGIVGTCRDACAYFQQPITQKQLAQLKAFGPSFKIYK